MNTKILQQDELFWERLSSKRIGSFFLNLQDVYFSRILGTFIIVNAPINVLKVSRKSSERSKNGL